MSVNFGDSIQEELGEIIEAGSSGWEKIERTRLKTGWQVNCNGCTLVSEFIL